MNLIIDNRENDLIQLIEKFDIDFEKKNLILGDISFNKDDNELLIIERKTLADLLASIKDGRYREQKIRLINKQKDKIQVYYLIEGDIYNHKQKDLIISCIFNTMIRDDLKIIYSRNLNDTLYIIQKLIKKTIEFQKIMLDKINNIDNKNDIDNKSNYSNVIKSEKKLNMTKDICYIAMLKQIPGVSAKCASVILKEYSSITDLIIKYQTLENENDKKNLLKNLIIEKNKIGPKLSEKIYNYLI